MLKHIITSKCDRGCSYCISKNVKVKESGDLLRLDSIYRSLSREFKEIMITGGEPMQAKFFNSKVFLAREYFFVYLTTQSTWMLHNYHFAKDFQAITFSLHGKINPLPGIYTVEHNVPVYAAIMAENYYPELPAKLNRRGFSGLTINEDHWLTADSHQPAANNHAFVITQLPELKNFSIKVNHSGDCLDDTYILPDYRVVRGFREFM